VTTTGHGASKLVWWKRQWCRGCGSQLTGSLNDKNVIAMYCKGCWPHRPGTFSFDGKTFHVYDVKISGMP
jgi:hypothetical protein